MAKTPEGHWMFFYLGRDIPTKIQLPGYQGLMSCLWRKFPPFLDQPFVGKRLTLMPRTHHPHPPGWLIYGALYGVHKRQHIVAPDGIGPDLLDIIDL